MDHRNEAARTTMKTNLTASDVRGHEHSLLCLIEDACLDVLLVGARWVISDPEHDDYVLGDGATVDAAVLAALPEALREGYVDRRDIDALLYTADAGFCGTCQGCGEGFGGPSTTCYSCNGTGLGRGDA